MTAALRTALESQGGTVPRDLWHGVLFYTAGRVSEDLLRPASFPDYDMYMRRFAVYRALHDALDAHWGPWIDGNIDLETAAARLVGAVAESARGSGRPR